MTDHVRLADLEGSPAAEALSGDPRVVRLRLASGESIPPHDHPGATVLLVVLEGRLRVELGPGGESDRESHAVEDGELLRADGDRRIAVEAVQDATTLVVLAGAE